MISLESGEAVASSETVTIYRYTPAAS